jgi:uncharacterized membrane protein (DUF2068 family)
MRLAKTLRTIAVYEAVKGALVLLTGFGLLAFVHRDVEQFADQVVAHFHLDAASRFPRIFLNAAAHLTDAHLWMLAALAAAYAVVRFVEAYGLWLGRRWAEWFAALSAAVYLPFEIYELFKGATWIAVGALVANILVIGLMVAALHRSRPARPAGAT